MCSLLFSFFFSKRVFLRTPSHGETLFLPPRRRRTGHALHKVGTLRVIYMGGHALHKVGTLEVIYMGGHVDWLLLIA
jgi:hypothetical protein